MKNTPDLMIQIGGVILRVLGERLNGIQEVSGSIPLISTKKIKTTLINKAVFIFCIKQNV